MQHTFFVHFFAVVLQDSGVGGEIRNSFQNIQIWRRNKIKYRKGKLAKQNENYQKHWADVEWHKSGAITIKTQILSQERQRASITCRQNINFWFRSHVSQSSELCHFHISHNTLCLHVSCPPTAQTAFHKHCLHLLCKTVCVCWGARNTQTNCIMGNVEITNYSF